MCGRFRFPWRTMDVMGLFTRHAAGVDVRDRDYFLTDCPLVAQDDQAVLIDVIIRLAVRRATDDPEVLLGYNPAEETAMHAIAVLVLRQVATYTPSEELMTSRARVAEALEQGFAFAPVGAGVQARVLSVEVRPGAGDLASYSHEFRVVNP
jgi:hypothetical protein